MAAPRGTVAHSRSDRLVAYLGDGNPLSRRATALAERLRHRAQPNHWSFLFGVVSISCLTVLTVTGLALMWFYDPSSAVVRYHGSYPLLRGVEMSRAFESVLQISLDVPGGLVLRQAHHWAALLLPASLIMQLLSTFFTGAFRRPRQWTWVLLFGIFVLTLIIGWSGYALPDDNLSGTGLRIVQGVTLGIPIIGSWATWILFGGEFPGAIIKHVYVIHLVTSAVLVLLVAVRLRLSHRQKPPQFAGPGHTENNVVGQPVWPNAATRATGLFFITVGLVMLMAATMTISPVWLYGPSSSANAFAGSQPDWYTAFLDGALRLVPPGWEVVWLGRTWTLAILVPLAVIGLFFTLVATYPFLEGWISADRRDHHILDRPRDTPTRTGLGAAGVTFYATLWLAASADVIATQFGVSFEGVIRLLRGLILLGPPAAYLLTRQLCYALQASDRQRLRHGAETGRILQQPSGGYIEPHQQLGARQRWALMPTRQPRPLEVRPDMREKVGPVQRLRIRLSRSFVEDKPERE